MSQVHRRLITFTDPAEQNLEMVRRELGISRSLAVRMGLEQLKKRLSEQKRPVVPTAAEKGDQNDVNFG